MAGRALSVLLAAGLSAAPSIACACPSCGIRDNAPGRMLVLVGMILLPFGVGATAVTLIRRMMRAERLSESLSEIEG